MSVTLMLLSAALLYLISSDVGLYLRDCYDHTVQMIDVIETDRELCADLRDFYLTVASNRTDCPTEPIDRKVA